jgi:hypothetical protein
VTATTETGDLPVVTAAIPAPTAAPTEVAAPVSLADSDAAPAAAPAGAPAAAAEPAGPMSGLPARLRALPTQGLTGPGATVLAVLVVIPGVLLDLARDGSFGLASSVLFVLAALAAALTVRVRALATAAVLPPLLFAGAVTALAYLSGNNEGTRELVLDVGTTLAVSAPLLFGGTAAALAVVLGRVVVHLTRR